MIGLLWAGAPLTASSEPAPGELKTGFRPPVDRDAMREAMQASQPGEPLVSGNAYLHYLQGAIYADRGDHVAAINELRQALVYDDESIHARVRLAWEYWRLGKADDAERVGQEALRVDPRSAEAHFLLGTLYLQRDKVAAAARELERATTADPTRSEAYRLLVQALLALGEEKRAEKALDSWASRAPGEPLGWREYGELHLSHGDLARAERYLRRALAFVPEDPEALAALGRIAEKRRDGDAALAYYERSLRSDPEEGSVLFALGRLHLRRAAGRGDPSAEVASAKACFNSLVAVAAEEAPARAEVALAYLQAHMEADAYAQLDDAVGADPDNTRWRYYRAMVELQLRRYSQACDDFTSIPVGDENYVDSQAKLGLALYKQRRIQAAILSLRVALVNAPNSPDLKVMLAEVERAAGNASEAVAILEPGTKAGGSPELVEALADAYEGAGRLGDAIALLQHALQLRPREVRLRFMLGAKLSRQGDFEAAVGTMKELLRADPRNAEALNFIGYEYAERGIRLPEAERLVAQALALQPDNGLIADSLGWVYFKEGKLKLAIETLKRAARSAPEEPVILEHLGDVQADAGDPVLAAQSYARALKLLEQNPDQSVQLSVERKLQGLRERTAQRL
jgi:tetratricopeptide (TPR) repeat protein